MSSPSGDVVYHGVKSSHTGAIITVETPDGDVVGVVRHIAAHSPGGMTWGYGGSGPLDCARSLLTAALGGDGEWDAYGGASVIWDFRDEVVAGLEDEWRMSRSEILPWLDRRRA
jgi:RNA polymerase Rpb2, domain 3